MILTDINTYIKSRTDITTIYEESFPSTTECVMARGDPSSAKIKKYYDGAEIGEQLVTFYARGMNQTALKGTLEKIFTVIKDAQINITGYDTMTAERVSTVTLTNYTETKVYTFAFTARVRWTRSN
jgi:hypothetical protein